MLETFIKDTRCVKEMKITKYPNYKYNSRKQYSYTMKVTEPEVTRCSKNIRK